MMRITRPGFFVALLMSLTPGASLAQAGNYSLSYTTFNDGINAPVTVNATLTAIADPFATNGFLVQSITGTRGGQMITGLSDPFSEFYLPATVLPGYQFATNLDSFGITFATGGSDYQIYRGPSDLTFYHELQNPDGLGTGRLIQPASFSIARVASVPEPAAWGMIMLGVGVVGGLLRRRRALARDAGRRAGQKGAFAAARA